MNIFKIFYTRGAKASRFPQIFSGQGHLSSYDKSRSNDRYVL